MTDETAAVRAPGQAVPEQALPETDHSGAGTGLADLREYLTIPRVSGLTLSPDGNWLAATVQQVGPDGKKFVPSIWRVPVREGDGTQAARLTWSAEGEDNPAFLPDGSLLFVSSRPAPAPAAYGGDGGNGAKAAVWLLPAGGGEARHVASTPGGVSALATARAVPTFLMGAPFLPGAAGADDDAERRKRREAAGVTAILHDSSPLRFWDHDLGPDEPRWLTVEMAAGGHTGQPHDLTPDPGRALDQQHAELTPDGTLLVSGWSVVDPPDEPRNEIVVIDTVTGERRVLLSAPGFDFSDPRPSPDGRLVLCERTEHDTYDRPGDHTLVVADLAGGQAPVDVLAGFDRWPAEAAWSPDSAAIFFTADDEGRRPVFRVGLDGTPVTRLTRDSAAYESLCPSPDGRHLYALRSAIDAPPSPVRIDLAPASPPGTPVPLPAPGGTLALPGTLTELSAVADDGAMIRSWLVLPSGAGPESPAPLLLWVHGGPNSSWNAWSWRWNPWLMAARGYAVLLPDPALSTGYGMAFIARGWASWGPRPFADLMSITDAALARPEIDATRTAAMGGSYGGYMANWIAGHTERFSAIVSHAGLWALDQMFGTTDSPPHWRRQFGDPLSRPERYQVNSPHLHGAHIATPMLVIHGDRDYRVPIGEALRLWAHLRGSGGRAPAKFLYFPQENHWILTPGHVTVWYETIHAFLAEHVLGEPWQRPDLL
jgi:dipeptidyl aminopeptidase/acylaminoacyl peptidase